MTNDVMQMRAVSPVLQQIEQLGNVIISSSGDNCSAYFPGLVNSLDDFTVSIRKAYLS